MKIIFLHPSDLEDTDSGSRLRPKMMLKTLLALGYEVLEITGAREVRAGKLAELKQSIEKGEIFDYLYVESLSGPTNCRIQSFLGVKMLVGEHVDFDIIRLCINAEIPVGFFLRDLHWAFSDQFDHIFVIKRWYLRTAMTYFGRRELNFLNQEGITVFTPSRSFGKLLTLKWGLKSVALPPGARVRNCQSREIHDAVLELFYVGGVVGIYNPSVFMEGVARADQVRFTMCVRSGERKAVSVYENHPNFEIVEGFGSQLIPYYNRAHIAVYSLPPEGYVRLAYSVKISEFIANGLPIIAFDGTEIASFISEKNIGWVIPYRSEAVSQLLEQIRHHPDDYAAKQQNVLALQSQVAWGNVVARLEKKLLRR